MHIRSRIAVAVAMPLLVASGAGAQNPVTTMPGANLSWTDCGAAGSGDMSFGCDVNTGTSTLVISFVAPPGCDSLLAAEVNMNVVEGGVPTLDPWWQFTPGGCRAGAWAFSYNTTALSTCGEYWNNTAIVVSEAEPFPLPNSLRLLAAGAIPQGTQKPLAAGSEYDCCTLTFNHTHATGAGACPGCASQACVLLQAVTLVEAIGTPAGDFHLVGPPPGGRNRATWQGAGAIASCDAVPAQNRTWGQIKSRYR